MHMRTVSVQWISAVKLIRLRETTVGLTQRTGLDRQEQGLMRGDRVWKGERG